MEETLRSMEKMAAPIKGAEGVRRLELVDWVVRGDFKAAVAVVREP